MTNRISQVELKQEKDRLLGQAWGHAHLGFHQDAVVDCRHLVALDGNDPHSHIELGYYYEKNGQIAEAEQCYRSLLTRFPDYADAYINLGYLYAVYKKREDIALVCYEKALELNPQHFWAWNNIGVILQAERKWQDAMFYYEQALLLLEKEEKPDAKIMHNLAWAAFRCKDFEKAHVLYALLLADISEDPAVYFEFGCVNYKMGEFDEAWSLFEQAALRDPENKAFQRCCRMARRKYECGAYRSKEKTGSDTENGK